MQRALAVAATALLAATTFSGCGGAADAALDPMTADDVSAAGVLKGAEFGLARGSATEVPFDEAAQTGGHLDSLDATAVVPFVSGAEEVTVEITPISVEKGDLGETESSTASRSALAGADLYYVRYRMAYVNGPVLSNVAGGWFQLAHGMEVVTDEVDVAVSDGFCGDEYEVEQFGKGAYLESCTPLLVPAGSPRPDTIMWQAPVTDGPYAAQASWPMP